MPRETRPFDPAVYLDSEAALAADMAKAGETDDAAFIADAIGVIARAFGLRLPARPAAA